MVDSALSEISSHLVRKALLETIEEQLQSKNFKIRVTSASKAGENNFIGIIHRITFTKLDEDGNENGPATNLILKVAPQNLLRRSQFVARPAFEREIYSYEKILPAFRQFERSKLDDFEKNGFTEYPKCYRTVDLNINEGLIFEDLAVRGFSTIDRRTEEVTVDHLRLVMQSLGKLHAISFAMKNQQPQKFKELAANLSEVFIRTDDAHLRECFTKQAQLAFDAVSGSDDAHLLAKVKKLFEKDAIDVAAECLDLKLTGSASVISHGDMWQNNVLYQTDQNGKPIEICFLDWQTVRQASPVIDIIYFIFCCTTKTLRDTYNDELLKIYHECLSTHIERLGSDPKLFPYELMLEHFRKFAKFGLILATVLLPMITSEVGNGLDLDGIGNQTEGANANSFISQRSQIKLMERLRDVIIDMVRLEYI